jgi:hypothetical protein
MQYWQFEEALVRKFSIQEANLSAFRARLRHLRSLGIPKVPKHGSGNTVIYRKQDLFSTFVALALQTIGSSPAVSAKIAKLAAEYVERLKSEKEELFLIVTNVPENIGKSPKPPPGVESWSFINNALGGTILACIVSGETEAGKFATHVNPVASSVINLSARLRELPNEA